VALQADEIEPAEEFPGPGARGEHADPPAIGLDPGLDPRARPGDVAVLQQRHEVVADGPGEGILEIEDTQGAVLELHQVARVIVAVHEHDRLRQRLAHQEIEGRGEQLRVGGLAPEPEMPRAEPLRA
jgi:hypothetical protein